MAKKKAAETETVMANVNISYLRKELIDVHGLISMGAAASEKRF